MKKIICLLLICFLLVSLCACGDKGTISMGDNNSEFESGLTDIPTDTNKNDESSEVATPIAPPELTEEQKAEQEQLNKISACKEYLSTVKIYLCDYSVFNYDSAVSLEYISPSTTTQENGCSVVMVVDWVSRELKEKYNPRFSFSVPNITKKEGTDGVVATLKSWNISDTITIYSHRFSHVVDIKDMSYGINCKDFDVRVRHNLEGEPIGFESVLSLLTSETNSVKIIDGRAYMLLPKDSDIKLKTANGVDKYFVDDSYIYIPLTKGAEITLS